MAPASRPSLRTLALLLATTACVPTYENMGMFIRVELPTEEIALNCRPDDLRVQVLSHYYLYCFAGDEQVAQLRASSDEAIVTVDFDEHRTTTVGMAVDHLESDIRGPSLKGRIEAHNDERNESIEAWWSVLTGSPVD